MWSSLETTILNCLVMQIGKIYRRKDAKRSVLITGIEKVDFYDTLIDEYYGIICRDSHKEVKYKKGELFVGGQKVPLLYDLENLFPVLYVIRDENNRFVCGMDLKDNGSVWCGLARDKVFDSVDDVLDFVKTETNNGYLSISMEDSICIDHTDFI